ncbi:MAG: hypothetical protein FOGNACKC_04281 [Anaerolineae bacterium]|nr:hypothetical protein [Anaerolineae bacterium]
MQYRKLSVVSILALAVIILMMPLNALAQDPVEFLVSLDDPAAPFLESRAVAAKLGASAEFRKMEGVAVDAVNNKLYIAMTEIAKTMTDDEGDIKLKENKCGVVYEADLDKEFSIANLKPVVVGGPYDENNKDNPCNVDSIANPDNLFVDSKGRLWIGEDTGLHANNMLWVWDGKTLQRFAAVPTGAEVTGLHISANDTVFMNVQHPSAMSVYPYNRGVVGVVNGFKAGDAFTPIAAPTGDQMHTVTVAAGKYQVLGRVGEAIPENFTGGRFGQVNKKSGSLMQICNHPDGNMFLPTTKTATEGYLYTNYECQPGAVVKLYIRQNGESWDVLEGENVDFASVNGTWNNCNASVTPWNTGLSSEEYEPIAAKDGWIENVAPMTDYIGAQANPYDYGYLVELLPDQTGDGVSSQVVKHYAMGRASNEMGLVMPDGKTVYRGDDGTGVVLFKFVADTAGDLSAGTLYAAKVAQQPDDSFKLTWIKLGSGNDADLADAIAGVALPK